MVETTQLQALRQIQSRRLSLIASTRELIGKDIEGPENLAEALGCAIPQDWPPELYNRSAMRFALMQLDDPAEQGWSFWYLTTRDEPGELVGICGFKGRPDAAGSVEIGYSIIDDFRRQGLATEAVTALVGWAFSRHNVSEVSAETFPYLRQSIRVLEKNGFHLTGPGSEAGVVRYVVSRESLK
jgi:RimJ/RimL family protein N-acetyltransferase